MNFSPIMKACAKPSGDGCSAYSNFTPNWLPSPESRLKPGKSKGVENRFIKDWYQLLADTLCDGVQTCTASSC